MYLIKLKNILTEEQVFPVQDKYSCAHDEIKESIKLDKTFKRLTKYTFIKGNHYYYRNIPEQTRRIVDRFKIKSKSLVANKDKELKKILLNIEKAHRLYYKKMASISKNERAGLIRENITEEYNLEANFIHAIDRILTYREFNKIYSISTLGTPFYFKSWRISKRSKILDTLIGILISIIKTTIIFLFVYILGDALNMIVEGCPEGTCWTFMNWDRTKIVTYIFATILMIAGDIYNLSTRSRVDTNVYFNSTKLKNIIKNLGDRKISKILVIHANHLDEAFLGLSSLPIIGNIAGNRFKNINKPKLWNFTKPHKVIDIVEDPLEQREQKLHYYISYSKVLIENIFGIFTYPIRYIVFNIRNWLVTHKVFSTIRELLLGLPKSEFSKGNIDVRNKFEGSQNSLENINQQNQDIDKYFAIDSINVDEHITVIKVNNVVESERYSFLSKKGVELEPYIKKSMLGKEQKIDFSKLTDEEIWNLLSLEERGKEFFGIAGLRHSMYYEQKEIVDMIGEYIVRESK